MKDKPILHLNVKKKWFDMIKSGEKKEEYRDISAYWTGILGAHIKIKKRYYHPSSVIICFSNGYAKNRPQIFIECKNLWLGKGKKEWGASEMQQFILSLGKIV
jgi:hypothetical protein